MNLIKKKNKCGAVYSEYQKNLMSNIGALMY